ncbi:MAG: hypothetical protein A3D92_03175 [Bacteroidetes bacterium RIFCSPHIGHO2_02_FULL_44_7]|nr:MAG: hypothetical protein A3D92_03175 [Bacteroidetes bacterium RIFCSPHIGHO2_02_FULL_44_7]
MKVIFIFSLGVLVLSSCKKEENGATSVDIVFTEPAASDTVLSYNQVHAEGTIVGDGTMEGYTVSLIDAGNGTVLYTNMYDVQAQSYNFHEHWTNNLSDTTLVNVRVVANMDKNGNTSTREVQVLCLP